MPAERLGKQSLAIRFNPELAAKYKQMQAAGKLAKVALVAIMRKILILANSLVKENRVWGAKMT